MNKRLVILGLLVLLALLAQQPVARASLAPTGDMMFNVPWQNGIMTAAGGVVAVDSLTVGTSIYQVSHGMLAWLTTQKIIVLMGGVPAASIADGTVLFSGNMTSSSSATFPDPSGMTSILYQFAQLAVTQNAALSQFFFGFVPAPETFSGALSIVKIGDNLFGSAGTKAVATPVPPSALLLGGGLMGIGIVRKRVQKTLNRRAFGTTC